MMYIIFITIYNVAIFINSNQTVCRHQAETQSPPLNSRTVSISLLDRLDTI